MQGQNSIKCKHIQTSRDNNRQKSQSEKNINNTKKNCYTTLNVLCKIKRYTSLPVRKHQAESFTLTKLDYCNNLFFDIPKYMNSNFKNYKMQQLVSF